MNHASSLSAQLIFSGKKLSETLAKLQFPEPVAYTYNPLEYAWERYCEYLEKFASHPKKSLFLGMNPGPFGMAQTGVPFGEIPAVRDWLGISGSVGKPVPEHPKRPIEGFACPRSEVSGRRLWGLFAEKFGSAENFFSDHFVANFCPLVWMSASGSNITPDKLPAQLREKVEQACLVHLVETIEILQPKNLIGVGLYAMKQLDAAAKQIQSAPNITAKSCQTKPCQFTIGTILHPSPASPAANKFWPQKPIQQLEELGIW